MIQTTKVLVIDDDFSMRRLLLHLLKRAGFITFEAADVKEGLKVLNREEIHLVLTDVFLPDGNGVELVKTIKAAYPDIEIIAITSQGKIKDGVNAIKNGAFDYLQKEEDDLRIVSLLTKAAEKAHLQRRLAMLEKEADAAQANRTDIIEQNKEQIEKAVLIIKAIHSPVRQRMMQFIFKQGQVTVTDLFTTLEMDQSLVSQHLLILKNAGIVNAQREGKNIFYSANYTGIEKIVVFVQQLLGKN